MAVRESCPECGNKNFYLGNSDGTKYVVCTHCHKRFKVVVKGGQIIAITPA